MNGTYPLLASPAPASQMRLEIQSFGIWIGPESGGVWAAGPNGVLIEFMSPGAALAQKELIRQAHARQGTIGIIVRVRSFGGEWVEG